MAAPIHASERKTIEVRRDLRPYSAQIDLGGTVVVDGPAFRAVVTSSSCTFQIAAPTAVRPTTVMDPMNVEEVHAGQPRCRSRGHHAHRGPRLSQRHLMSELVVDRPRFPLRRALRSLSSCVVRTGVLLLRRAISQPTARVGQVLRFADGSHGRVYRETVVEGAGSDDPVVLIAESELNTPLFVGFPGFVSKLWLARPTRTPCTEGSTNGTAPGAANVHVARSGGSSHWSARRARFTTWFCRGCGVTTFLRTARSSMALRPAGRAAWWRVAEVQEPTGSC